MGIRWIQDEGALELLECAGDPFNVSAYRRAWTEALPGWRDVSFGAHASDGTQAAVALVRRRRSAESLPLGYGGVVASRPLTRRETSSFLRAARRAAHADELLARAVPIDPQPNQLHIGGRVLLWTSVVHLHPNTPTEERFAKKARQAISRAKRAGGVARAGSDDPEPFLRLYERVSREWSMQYPPALLMRLAEAGNLKLYNVELGGTVEASAVALRGECHWMYWLAAQSEGGRKAELGYLALARLIAEAHESGASAVNLGASPGLPGVADFKRRFGAVDAPIVGYASLRHVPVAVRDAVLFARRALNKRAPA